MMTGCAVATGLPDADEHVRGPAASSRERLGQGRGDPCPAASDRGSGSPTGREEGTVRPVGPCFVGGAVAALEAGGVVPDAVAGTPGHGAALAPRPDQSTARRPVQTQAAGSAVVCV